MLSIKIFLLLLNIKCSIANELTTPATCVGRIIQWSNCTNFIVLCLLLVKLPLLKQRLDANLAIASLVFQRIGELIYYTCGNKNVRLVVCCWASVNRCKNRLVCLLVWQENETLLETPVGCIVANLFLYIHNRNIVLLH